MEIVLNTFGTAISRDNEAFIVSTNEGRKRIPVDGVTSIRISRSAQITSDAILLAIENEIEVIFASKNGSIAGRVWSPRYGSISIIRKGQLTFCHHADAVNWIKGVIKRKMENQQAMLLMMQTDNFDHAADVDAAVSRIDQFIRKVKSIEADRIQDVAGVIRGLEGYSAKVYFAAMNLFLPAEYRFEARSQHPATDVTNALLNYGYGILYGKIENALIMAGIDPYIGILHRDEYRRPMLVYDVIEIFRIWIDHVVWSILAQKAVTDEMYSMGSDGSCYLEALGRRVIIQSVSDFLDEVITYKGMTRSRKVQIDLFAQELAQTFKKYQ